MTMPASEGASRDAQEAADAALARQLQEAELGTDTSRLDFNDDDDDFGFSDRRQRARRARRRVYALTDDNDIVEVIEGDRRSDFEIDPAGRGATRAGL
jgi:hypothetical protein